MDENKFLLAGNKFMPEMFWRQSGFPHSICGPFTKNEERLKKFKENSRYSRYIGDSRYIYQNELDIACFQHATAYGDFKDLLRRTVSDKILRDKAVNIAKNPKYQGYKRGFASVVYKCFDKKSSGGVVKSEIMPNQQLAEELHKPINRKIEKSKVHSSFKGKISVLI